VRGERLLVRGVSVPEEPPFARAHLEETQVLAVACRRRQARLAPRDVDCLVGVPPEDRPDRDPRRGLRQPASLSPRIARPDQPSVVADRAGHPGEATSRHREGLARDRPLLAGAQERPVRLEEADRAAEPASRCELLLETMVERHGAVLPLRARRLWRPLRSARYRSGLCHEEERAQANE